MASNGFQFKQFFIQHEQCAMKVGTDSILLGSWVTPKGAQKILDIGTGSGLLAIMLAQKSTPEAKITAIDIDNKAVEQARANVQRCPWPEKVDVSTSAVQDFLTKGTFDLIVSNPPYYAPKPGDLTPADPQFIESQRRLARHTVELTHSTLLACIVALLSDRGRCFLVLPEEICAEFIRLAEGKALFINEQLMIRTSPKKNTLRRILCLSKVSTQGRYERLCIHEENGEYSSAFRTLCKDFYLKF